MIAKHSVLSHKIVKLNFSVHTTLVLPKSLSGSGPIPSQGLGEDSCSMCRDNQNYSMGISSTYSGTCQLIPCDKPDFSARIYMGDAKGGFQIGVFHVDNHYRMDT